MHHVVHRLSDGSSYVTYLTKSEEDGRSQSWKELDCNLCRVSLTSAFNSPLGPTSEATFPSAI